MMKAALLGFSQSSLETLPLPSAKRKTVSVLWPEVTPDPSGFSTHFAAYSLLMQKQSITSFWANRSSIFSSLVLLKVSVFREARRSSTARYTCDTLSIGVQRVKLWLLGTPSTFFNKSLNVLRLAFKNTKDDTWQSSNVGCPTEYKKTTRRHWTDCCCHIQQLTKAMSPTHYRV